MTTGMSNKQIVNEILRGVRLFIAKWAEENVSDNEEIYNWGMEEEGGDLLVIEVGPSREAREIDSESDEPETDIYLVPMDNLMDFLEEEGLLSDIYV
tara:strand:+ start:2867 stop:3157 length:291 start_codon:yes stop_codon:yes gene_type:complete